MVELCLMASPPGLAFHPDSASCRVSKDCQPFCHNPGSRHGMMKLDTLNMRPRQIEEPWKPLGGFSEFVRVDSTITRPVLIDVQDTHPNSILFSFGIAEQCTRHEKILKFLMSGSDEVEGARLDLSMLSDLFGPQALTINNLPQALTINNLHQGPFASYCGSCTHGAGIQPSLTYPSSEFYAQAPLLELAGDLVRRSEISFYPNSQVSFTSSRPDLKDIISIVAEYYLSKNSTKWRKQSLLIPYFDRLDFTEARTKVHESRTMPENVKFAPLKSPEKIKLKPSQKKGTTKKARGRDLYRKNYFHACESLLSIMIDKKRNGKTAILSLKKSGPELPQFLTQFSAGIAGTGLAVLLSIICKVAYSRGPFCSSKLFSTSVGFGLFWLSWAVNKLRDTVVHISKNSGKLNLKEEELLRKLDRCVNEVFFRAATVMVVAVMRLV